MPINYDEIQTGNYAPVFKFNDKGDQIVGDVVEAHLSEFKNKRQDGTEYTQVNPCFTIRTEHGEFSVIAGQKMLRELVKEHDLQDGDRVRITMTGRVPGERGGEVKQFTVEVQKGAAKSVVPEPEPEWDDGEEPF